MLKNYIKIAFRNLYRNKIFSFINIVGLAIGLAASFCIMIYVMHELSYDKHHENYDKIYRVDSHLLENNFRVPYTCCPLPEWIKEEIPEVEEAVRINYMRQINFKKGQDEFNFRNNFVDTTIFNVFSFEFIYGDEKSAFSDPSSIVISAKTSRKIFGDKNPIGEMLTLSSGAVDIDFKVNAVFKDNDLPSTLDSEVLVPFQYLFSFYDSYKQRQWSFMQPTTSYLLISENVNLSNLEAKIASIYKGHIKNDGMTFKFHVIPLMDTYFIYDENNKIPFLPTVDKEKVILYSCISLIVLLLAFINYILLSSSKNISRQSEFGVRKIIGAMRRDIVKQSITESVIIFLLVLPLSFLMVEVLMPFIEEIMDKKASYAVVMNYEYLVGILLFFGIISIIGGIIISYRISRLNPISIIQHKNKISNGSLDVKKYLLGFQMIIFSGLIVSAIVLKSQLLYIFEKDLGFEAENIVYVDCSKLSENADAFKNNLIQYSAFTDFAFTNRLIPTLIENKFKISTPDEPEKQYMVVSPDVGFDYPRFLNLKVIAGNLPKHDINDAIILNESAVNELGLADPIGKKVLLFNRFTREIVAVVEDFHVSSLKEKIEPVAMKIVPVKNKLALRIAKGKTFEAMRIITDTWKKFSDKELEYSFSDDEIKIMYQDELRFEKAINLFTLLAVIVASLGFFGVVLYSVQQRTKEIGIRKVMGATVTNILKLLTKEFVLIVVAGSVIAFPLSYYLMSKWLNDFAYRITIGPEIFFYAFSITLVITLLTISIQAIKAAVANPVESLRDE